MIFRRYFKNSLVYLGLCAALLFLNNYFIVYEEAVHTENREVRIDYCPVYNLSAVCLFHDQKCIIDGEKELICVKDTNDVYIPFNFLKKQYDITGKYNKDDVFEWATSYAKLRVPEGEYDPSGEFGHFSTYNVENRDRVRCINGGTGVPMSTQWDTVPYYYPIQIAQYGLQHFSRFKLANTTKKFINIGSESREWKGSPGEADSSERVFFSDIDKGPVVNITAPGSVANPGCYIYLNEDSDLHLISFEWFPYSDSSFTVLVKLLETNTVVFLNYIESNDTKCIWPDASIPGEDQLSFNIALGELKPQWYKVTRDILVDASRALYSRLGTKKKKDDNVILHPSDIKLVTLGFRGLCTVRQEIQQKNLASEEFFLRSAEWFLNNQDKMGGWAVPVERSIADRRLVLPAGWHSAMAQGHALSLLSRAYILTENMDYLESAVNALDLFDIPAEDGGVLNKFFNTSWYEEYPTTPGSFVLNGFMYSLIGLYDFSSLEFKSEDNSTIVQGIDKAKELFETGIKSLKHLLPLYDTGSGSIYDLRHVGLQTAPNLARWDYHAVHVYLLKWLVKITGDQTLDTVANRWIGYSLGKRAKHN